MTKKEKVWRSGSAGKMYPGRAQRLKDEKEETAAVADAAGDKEDKVVKKGKKTKQKQGEDEKQKVKEEQKEEEEKLKEQKDSAAVIVLKGVSSKGMKRGKEVKGAKGTKEVKEEKEKVDTAQQTEEDKEDYAWVKAKKKAKKLKKDKKEKGKKGETGKKGKKEKKVEKEEKKKKRSKREKKPKEEEGGKEQVEVLESKILEEKGTELGKELASEASVPSVVEIPLITPQQIERELAERHAMERERVSLECLCRYRCRCPVHKWPVVSKVNIRTRHWEPPGRPQRPPKVIIKLPKLNLQPWIPPSELPRKPRSKTPRLLPEPPLPLLPCAKLKKAWHRFVQVEPNKMMLQGTIACNSKRYQPSFRGAQTACVAAVCRALLEETPPARLQRRDVDDVINAADYYYRICLKLNKCYKGPHQLELCQLVRGVFFRDWFYKFDLEKAEGGVLARLPVCSTDHKPPGKPPLDLFEIMEKFQGKEYMYILTVGRTKHFLIWGHPPEPEAGSNVKTVCYIFDPYMLDEAGTRNYCHGAGAILRYPGVTSFVVDFLTNHGHIDRSKDQCDIANTPITLTAMDILTKEPVPRAPSYSLELRALKPHCYGEREALYNNVMLDEKLYKHKWNIASLSAESVAISRRSSRWRVKLALGLVDDGKRPVPSDPRILPVPPEEPPPRITLADVLKYQGEDFFLFCPIRTDSHLYGRDDMIPYARSETVLHSHALLSQQANTSQFSQISDGKWILRGTRHFASYRYKAFKWYTGVACCVAALAALRRLRARSWNEDTVDETFDVGYNLLRESLLQRHGPIRSLVLGELASIFKMRDREYKFKKRNIVVWGQLISSNPKIYHLCRGIRKFFKEYDTGILQVPGVFETAIWYENKRYYIYHPWPADRFGNRVTLYEGGRGCLLSFSDMEALCDHFLENTREIKRKPYCISDVSVWDLGQRPEPINSMKAVGPNRWIVRGSFHEGSERFKPGHRNNQATPICITAIAMSTLIDPAEWTSNDIDETLIRGDFLYEKSMETLYAMGVHMEQPGEEEAAADEVAGEHGASAANVADEADVGVTGTIAAADVLTRFNISEADNIETDIQDSLYSGVLLPEPGSGLMSLKEALSALFAEHRAAVVTARDGSMAVWKHEDQYYFLDPHGCDENGLPTDDVLAKACLLRMSENVKELADVIMGNLTPGADDSFNVSPVDIIATKIDPATGAPEISREGKAFEWLNKNTATILMGPRREHTALGEAVTKCFIPKEDMAGRTLALPVVAAFCAATEAVPPPGMHREHMFNFLEAGGDYYRNHVKKTGRHDVTPEDLGEFFEMGVNTFSIEVGEPTELPLRQPDPVEITGEGGGGEEEEAGGEEEEEIKHEEENKDQMNEMKQLLYKMWFDNTKPTTVSLLLGDYHQLGVWMAAGGKVVAFDPAPTLAMGQLIRPRIVKGDELRLERLRAMLPEVVGEEIEGEGEEGGEGEQKPEPEPEVLFVPDDACPVLMWFNSPGEFIDKLVSKGGLDPQQAVAPYQLYPVTVITELTGSVQPKKPKPKRRSESALAEGEDAPPEPEPEVPVVAPPLPEPLLDEALGKYFERKTRTTASLRGAIAQHEPYFVDAPNRDNQDAANSIMAIAVHHIEPYEHWKPTLIDAILKYGDRLYTLSLPRAEHQPRLAPHEVLNDFHVTHFNIKTEVTPDVVTGDYKAPEASELNSLRKGLKQFFETENFGVICAKNYCAAVWKANEDKAWVYWDPHPVGPTGKLSPASVAGMVLFSTLDELADTFKTNLNNLERPGTNNYSISSVKAFWKLAESEDAGKIKSLGLGAVADEDYEFKVLTGYVEMARGRTILRGTRITQPLPASQFARDTVIWSAASAVVAVAMANVRRPPLWTVKTVDEIIRHGCSLFTSTLSNIGYEFRPCEDILHPLQLDRKFVLGSTFIRYEIEDVCHGKLEKKTFNEMSAELGLSRFFDKFSLGILWSAPHAVALWRLDRGPPYYMMEPHACGPTGLRTDAKEDAAPCVMTFTSPKLLTYAYLQNLPKSERHKYDYTLFRVRVTVTPIKPWGSGDPPLVRPPPGRPPNYTVIPATSKVGVDGLRRDVVRTVMHDAMCLVPQPTEEEMERLQELLWKGDKDQGLRNSNGWLVLQDGTQFLSSSHSIACKRFSAASRGNQDLACCVMAVAQSIILELCRWCVATLDSILDSGDQLYQDSYLHYHPKTKKLNMEQVLRKFYTPGNCVCRVMVFNARQHGSVDEDLDTFVTTLKQFFREENMGVFVAYDGEYAVTLFKNPRGFYLFDPHDCDRYGRAVPPLLTGRARACLSQFASVRCLAEKLKKNIPPPMTKTLNSERAPEMKVVATPEVKNVETSEVRAVETPEVKLVETLEVKPVETSEVKPVETSEAGPSGIPVPQITRQSSVHFTIPPPGVLKGRYSIYGMKVGSLRKLHAYEK